jgi:hypothetical protein
MKAVWPATNQKIPPLDGPRPRKDIDSANCDVKDQLASYYRLKLHANAVAVEALQSKAETVSASEYQKLKISADERRIDSELARLELQLHIDRHRCGHVPE